MANERDDFEKMARAFGLNEDDYPRERIDELFDESTQRTLEWRKKNPIQWAEAERQAEASRQAREARIRAENLRRK